MPQFRRPVALIALATAVVVQACGSSGDQVNNPRPGTIGLSLASRTMAFAAGDSGSVTVTIARTEVGGEVALAVANLPAGATAAFDPPKLTGNGSKLTVRTAGTVTPGNYDLLITATASGAPNATATLSLTVTAATASILAFKSVVTGGSSTCALTMAGAAYCWGHNLDGQAGNGTTSARVVTPTAVSGGLTFESLTLPDAGRYACGLRTDGAAYCWGGNTSGQLGNGAIDTLLLTPTAVTGGLKFVSLTAGGAHTCGLAADSVAYCWGDNQFGGFGDGTVKPSLVPVIAAPGRHFKALSAGALYTCGLTSVGATLCWGYGTTGQLGNGGTVTSQTPVAVAGGVVFSSLSVGSLDACGLTTTGEAYCWGYNSYGEVGDGTATQRPVPTAVGGGLRFSSLRMGFEHACGVVASGTAYCWGYNESGAIGDGTGTHRSAPTTVVGGLTFQNVSISDFHACGTTQIVSGRNDIYCWGQNASGELGDGTTTASLTPIRVLFPH